MNRAPQDNTTARFDLAGKLARLLGVREATVHEWFGAGCPPELDGALEWILAHKRHLAAETITAELVGSFACPGCGTVMWNEQELPYCRCVTPSCPHFNIPWVRPSLRLERA